MPRAALVARGVFKPRRPRAPPLFRLVSDHLHRLQAVNDERFAREYGPWASAVVGVGSLPVVGDAGGYTWPWAMNAIPLIFGTGEVVSLLTPRGSSG